MARQHPDVPFVIDFHTHMLDDELRQICTNRNAITGFGQKAAQASAELRKFLDPEVQIADMDARGIDMHVVFTGPVYMSTWWADAHTALELTRRMNRIVADWVRRFPTRFIGSATLPMQDVALAASELERCVKEHGHKAVMLPTNVEGAYLGERKFWPLWETIRALDLAVFIHPEGLRDPWYHRFALWNSLGQSIEEARVMASMIYEGLMDAIPGLKVVVAHGGGYFPTYMGRLDRNILKPEAVANIKGKPSDYLRHFYYDTCVYDALALEMLFRRVGADRIVLGADYPVGDVDPVGVIKQAVSLPAPALVLVGAGTAARLLGIEVPNRADQSPRREVVGAN
jgi:aminocarboxymuconate-semialdehyde decarboxylase